jgi:hypothetical protein
MPVKNSGETEKPHAKNQQQYQIDKLLQLRVDNKKVVYNVHDHCKYNDHDKQIT